MSFSTLTSRWIARLLLGLLLFAQGMVAANACDGLTANATQALAQAAADSAPCHDEEQSNPNVCLEHCTQGDRISGHFVLPAFLPASTVVWQLAPPVFPVTYSLTPLPRLALNGDPPLAIRFCSFQI